MLTNKMNQIKELRVDLFMYFVLFITSPLPVWLIISFTVIWCLRIWWPDILIKIDEELEQEPDTPKSIITPNFRFDNLNDLKED